MLEHNSITILLLLAICLTVLVAKLARQKGVEKHE